MTVRNALPWLILPVLLPALWLFSGAALTAQAENELRLSLRHDPKTFDPALVDESAGETIRYLTGGVLIRVNRLSQKAEPELAQKWSISKDGRTLGLELRPGVRFSDGTPLTPEDVAYTFRRLLDPALRSPTGDSFRSGVGSLETKITGPLNITVKFPAAVAAIERVLDQVAIQSASSPLQEKATAGPFMLAAYKPGIFVHLKRNPHYWKRDARGARLPYLDGIRFSIQANRDMESVRLRRGELHMVDAMDPELFDRLKREEGIAAVDAGATTDIEMLWFNQSPAAPIPEFKKAWFRSRGFRQALSAAIHRGDIARLAYKGYAQPAIGPVPPNSIWANTRLSAPVHDPAEARRLLVRSGFRYAGTQLRDSGGNPVVFSLVTNASSKVRPRIAALIQQDLARIGIQLNIAPLEFRSLIERMSKTFDYEACLLGLVNVDDDPNGQMNIWLSSGANHPWNPMQKSPATPWEAEIDRLMTLQAASADARERKKAFDRVQELARQESPILFLVNTHALVAHAKSLRNLAPAPARPHLFWNIERLSFGARGGENGPAVAAR